MNKKKKKENIICTYYVCYNTSIQYRTIIYVSMYGGIRQDYQKEFHLKNTFSKPNQKKKKKKTKKH